MVVMDRNKTQYLGPHQLLALNTAAPFSMLRGLHGLGLNISDSLESIAAFDPEPISSTALQVGATASKVITQIESFLGIGAGRREADQIVPIQNQMHMEIIKPVYDVLEMPDKSGVSCTTLASLYQSAYAAWTKWIDFLHNTQWSDGRAAVQAENTLAPYWNTILGSPNSPGGLEQIFNAKQCGVWRPPTIPGAQATITVSPVSVVSSGFANVAESLRQNLPLVLGVVALAMFSRSSKPKG